MQCSAKALEKWGQMTHTTEKYGYIGNFLGVTYVILPFVNLKLMGTWAPTAKIIGDIPDFNALNVPKTQRQHNPEHACLSNMLVSPVWQTNPNGQVDSCLHSVPAIAEYYSIWKVWSCGIDGEWVSECLNIRAFLGTMDSKVHISHVIIVFTLESHR